MTCDHRPVSLDVEDLGARCVRVTCSQCGTELALGPSPDPTGSELALAIALADIHVLWEPGRERDERIAWAVEAFR